MDNSKNTKTPKTADVKLPGDHMQNEKKMPTFHHPAVSPKPKK